MANAATIEHHQHTHKHTSTPTHYVFFLFCSISLLLVRLFLVDEEIGFEMQNVAFVILVGQFNAIFCFERMTICKVSHSRNSTKTKDKKMRQCTLYMKAE